MPLELITERRLIRTVASRWRERYSEPLYVERGLYQEQREKQAALDALDPEMATPADIEAIIGNDSWTGIYCNNCRSRVTRAVRLGDEPDYESQTAIVCEGCLKAALALLSS